MNVKSTQVAILAAAALGLSLSGCGSGGSGGGAGSGAASASFNAGLTSVVNPSEHRGGIVTFADEGTQDSVDPGNTYSAPQWNFARLYGRALTMFTVAPGAASARLVGDLAEDVGVSSGDGRTWTYRIRRGVRFEDGTEVRAQDVKYAIERSTDKETFPNGPAYFDTMLAWPSGWKGPYTSKGMNTDAAISTPDDYTLVLHMKRPFAGMDYLAMTPQTIPVPAAADTGAKYKEHVVSSGPYKFASYQDGKSYALERNPSWDPATDPNRTALPDGFEMQMNVDPEDIDNRLISGDVDIAMAAVGVTPATQSKLLGDPALKARADNPTLARVLYTSINPTVAPFDDIECRKAIEYGMDKVSYQTANGGPFAGGELATSLMTPVIPGYQRFDLYPTAGGKGDLEQARAALASCGQPDGFSTNIAYRIERPKEKALAEAFQQQLAKIGIEVTPKGYPRTDYFATYAGNPPYVVKNDLGLVINSWQADWNEGFGALSQIVDSRTIRETGGSSNTSVRIPEVDRMIDQAVAELDDETRNALWAEIDRKVMEQAVVYPGVYAKTLLLRGKDLTNVFVNRQFGAYDYAALGKP